MKAGIVGTGAIAPAYMEGLSHWGEDVTVAACADLNMERATAFADTYGVTAMTVDDLLAADDVELIINLTIPVVHAKVTMQIVEAGKHAYCEKPLAINLADGEAVMQLADEKDLRVGCAPDTFLGSGGQTARRAIDEGYIGRAVSATAFFEGPGPDGWHPNPFFYYTEGGGPMLDMGPYYITALVNLLGGVASVTAMTGTGFEDRVA
ncbi:MAG: Gfo/Idh/MocA family oxidoreductase, partial [Chloroflexota bacterium]